ncbi:MAG TPA: pentapeptide repeat-containing protein [Nostocaceae cyanobacterium]|nr:pentapeptide repeat-containing protein [Nostocaceae cyanobacterium]
MKVLSLIKGVFGFLTATLVILPSSLTNLTFAETREEDLQLESGNEYQCTTHFVKDERKKCKIQINKGYFLVQMLQDNNIVSETKIPFQNIFAKNFRTWGSNEGKNFQYAEIYLTYAMESENDIGNRSGYLKIVTRDNTQFLLIFLAIIERIDTSTNKILVRAKLSSGEDSQATTNKSETIKKLLKTKVCIRCDLSGVDLQSADLNDVNLEGANLQGANLTKVKLNRAYLVGANLDGANLSYAELNDSHLPIASLVRVNLERSKMHNSSLNNANLEGSILRKISFDSNNLRGTDLQYANMKNTDLTGSDIRGVNMMSANLENSIMIDTNLNTTFVRRHETGYKLTTNVQAANFKGANLKGADIRGVNIDQAFVCSTTIMPDGSKSPNSCLDD